MALQVQGRAIVPAAAMFEVTAAAARSLLDWPGGSSTAVPVLCEVAIHAPLQLALASSPAALVFTCKAASERDSLQLTAGNTVHLSSSSTSCTAAPAEQCSTAALTCLLPRLQGASTQRPGVLAGLAAHGGNGGTTAEYWMHPAALDATIHAGTALNPTSLSVPTSVAAFAAPVQLGSRAAWAAAGNLAAAYNGSANGDFAATPATSSSEAAWLQQLHSEPVSSQSAAQPTEHLLYQVQWRAAEPADVDDAMAFTVPPPMAASKVVWWAVLPDQTGSTWVQPAVRSAAALVSGAVAWLQASTAHASIQQGSRIGLRTTAPADDGLLTSCCGSGASGGLGAAGLAGLLRSVAREQPGTSFYSMLSSSYSTFQPAQHQAERVADAYGSVTAGRTLLLPRLAASTESQPVQHGAAAAAAAVPGLAGRVLVSGGLGDLGLLAGTWLAGATGTHAMLLGRSPHGKRLPAALLGSGSLVSAALADAASREDVAALVGLDGCGPRPLCGIIHAGGMLADASLARQTAQSVRIVMAPKVRGGQLLTSLAAAAPMQLCVLFSSTAALVGPAGQANYAAANAMLGGLAAAAQQGGQSSLSVLWGAWSVGMAGRDAAMASRIQRSGMGLIAPAQGLQAVAHLVSAQRAPLGSQLSSAVATPFDFARLRQAAAGAVPAMFEDFSGSTRGVTPMLAGNGGQAVVAAPAAGRAHPASALSMAVVAAQAAGRAHPASALSMADVARQVAGLVRASLGSEVGSGLCRMPSTSTQQPTASGYHMAAKQCADRPHSHYGYV